MLAGSSPDGACAVAIRGWRFATTRARWRIAVPARRRTGFAPIHNVIDLQRIDRFILNQRIRHYVQLIAVLFEDALSSRIAFINDPAYFLIDVLRGFTGHRA